MKQRTKHSFEQTKHTAKSNRKKNKKKAYAKQRNNGNNNNTVQRNSNDLSTYMIY